jgi:hypothetical protein
MNDPKETAMIHRLPRPAENTGGIKSATANRCADKALNELL